MHSVGFEPTHPKILRPERSALDRSAILPDKCEHWRHLRIHLCKVYEKKMMMMQLKVAAAGNRTQINCLEGNYANRYTTAAYNTQQERCPC